MGQGEKRASKQEQPLVSHTHPSIVKLLLTQRDIYAILVDSVTQRGQFVGLVDNAYAEFHNFILVTKGYDDLTTLPLFVALYSFLADMAPSFSMPSQPESFPATSSTLP